MSEQVAVVTGGAGAIGSAIGEALKADGLRVVVVDRTGDITDDLSSESSARAAAAAAVERHGHERSTRTSGSRVP
jgi:nucleoside-diphosphate-sugar epimerase